MVTEVPYVVIKLQYIVKFQMIPPVNFPCGKKIRQIKERLNNTKADCILIIKGPF
jgi:hypothetical protein